MNYLPSSSQCNTDKNYSDTLTSKSEINCYKNKTLPGTNEDTYRYNWWESLLDGFDRQKREKEF